MENNQLSKERNAEQCKSREDNPSSLFSPPPTLKLLDNNYEGMETERFKQQESIHEELHNEVKR